MSEAIVWLTIFVLSVFVGIEVISKVSSTLHTPLMSGANAIHGVILLMTRDEQFAPDFNDEVVAAICLTHAGELRGQANHQAEGATA